MWNPFRHKPLLNEEDRYFQHACYRWLLRHFGGEHFYRNTRLVLPTVEFFPAEISSNTDAARQTFERVKHLAGLQQWPTVLQAQEADPEVHVAPGVIVQGGDRSPLGTFQMHDGNAAVITYNPEIITDPTQMVATFAHELSHYLSGTAPEPPPGGWENWEFATDICATFLGFGIFVANSAFNFRQYTTADGQGWQTRRSGYLSEAEHSYALAIFLLLKDIPFEQALPHCDANIRSYLKRAAKELASSAAMDELRQTEYLPGTIETN